VSSLKDSVLFFHLFIFPETQKISMQGPERNNKDKLKCHFLFMWRDCRCGSAQCRDSAAQMNADSTRHPQQPVLLRELLP